MATNIDLGTFNWDISKIEQQLISNRQEMEKFSDAIKANKKILNDEKKEIDAFQKGIDAMIELQKQLNEEKEAGIITEEDYNKEMENSNILITESKKRISELSATQSAHIKTIIDSENAVKGLRLENAELNKLHTTGRTEIEGNEGAYRDLNKELNALKIESKNLGAELVKLKRAGQENTEEYRSLEEEWKRVSQQADILNDDFKSIDGSVGDNQRNVGAYKEAIVGAFSEITQGAMQLASGNVTDGFESIKNGFTSLRAAAIETYAALLANPLTALVVALSAVAVGIGLGVKEMFEYNASIKENIKLVEDLTNTSGQISDDIRLRGQALAETFGGDFKEVIQTANVLAKQLGISYEQAFDKIQDGYVRGANANGDFLDRLREYAPLLEKYGFNIDEIIALQVQAQEQGIFNDKFEDSLKEAGLSLEEFTKAQSDALTNSFGKEFSDKISQGINSGALSVKDALLLMGTEAKKQNLSVQQWGTITADVFKGAGEDAGGAKKVIDNVYTALIKAGEPYTELQQKTDEYADAMTLLKKAKDEALKSDGIVAFQSAWDIAIVNIQTGFYKFIGTLIDGAKWIDEVTGFSDILFSLFQTGKEYISSVKGVFNELVGALSDLFDALGLNNSETGKFVKTIFSAINPLNIIRAVFKSLISILDGVQLAIRTVRVNFTAFTSTIKTVFSQLSNIISNFDFTSPLDSLKKFADINISGTFSKAQKEAEKAIETKKALDKAFKDDVKVEDVKVENVKAGATVKADTKKVSNAKKAVKDAEKAVEDATKKELELQKEKASQSIALAKSELAEYISLNAEKYKDDKTLLSKKLEDQKAYFDEVARLKSIELEKEKEAQLLTAKSEEEKSQINRDFALKEVELKRETETKKSEIQKTFDAKIAEQKKVAQAIEFQQRLLDLEIEGASEYEVRQAQLDQETQQKLDAFLLENDLKRISDQENYDINAEIQAQRTELENEIALVNDENEKLRLQNKLNGLNLLEAQSAEQSKQIEQSKQNAILSGYAQTFGNVADLLGKNTALGKTFAIADATIQGYQAVMNAYTTAQKSPITLVNPAYPFIQAGIAGAFSVAQIAKIATTKAPKAAKGMLIKGNSHANGGVNISTPNGIIEAEGGEPILTKKAFQMFPGLISDINVAGGGVPLYAKGGMVGTSNLSSVQNNFKLPSQQLIIDENSLSLIANAIYAGSQSGISDLSTNRKIANGANF